MATIQLPPDFKEFLRLLHSHEVRYLLVGGYAVAIHGYPRTTLDLDVWIDQSPENASRVVGALREFGFAVPDLTPELFQGKGKLIRMGMPPVRIEIATSISGVEFSTSYASKRIVHADDFPIHVIGLAQLKANKRAAGRSKDLVDLENLPEHEE